MYQEKRIKQLHLKKNMFLIYGGIIAVCFLYTGSAYMSQFYRLMEMYDGVTVDLITSGWNYIMQAIGIAIFSWTTSEGTSFLIYFSVSSRNKILYRNRFAAGKRKGTIFKRNGKCFTKTEAVAQTG